jgi:uncharacterized protein
VSDDRFVDSSAWIAILVTTDERHVVARNALAQALSERWPLVTTNLVVAESYISLRRELGRRLAMEFLDLDLIHRSQRLVVVRSNPEIEERAEALLAQYSDQDFSYVDAVSFVVMHERGITEAFAFDHHFMTVGFVTLPAPR